MTMNEVRNDTQELKGTGNFCSTIDFQQKELFFPKTLDQYILLNTEAMMVVNYCVPDNLQWPSNVYIPTMEITVCLQFKVFMHLAKNQI